MNNLPVKQLDDFHEIFVAFLLDMPDLLLDGVAGGCKVYQSDVARSTYFLEQPARRIWRKTSVVRLS
jgi:hypothetical protein